MWFRIRSTLFFLQCVIGVLDMFTFGSAEQTTSTRSTPKPLTELRTVFEPLNYWSGESTTRPWKENLNYVHERLKEILRLKKEPESISTDVKTNEHARRQGENTTEEPEINSLERTIRNTKLNGYTLKEDMSLLLESLNANTSVSVIGKTIELHDIVLCKLSNKETRRRNALRNDDGKYVDDSPQKKIILIVHGLSSMGFHDVPCLIRKRSFVKLLEMYVEHLDKFDIFLIPMGNPDGIADMTRAFWNKNKTPQKLCSGVAVDRNFDVHFNKSHDVESCSQQYPGAVPFSEPESRAVADIIHYHHHNIIAYIHVHAAGFDTSTFTGDAVLFPPGYVDGNFDEKYYEINSEIDGVIKESGFRSYGVAVTTLNKWYGQVTGTSVDYATLIYSIPYGMEFVMQSYEAVGDAKTTSEEVNDNVLTEVWKKVIGVVFDRIFKSTREP